MNIPDLKVGAVLANAAAIFLTVPAANSAILEEVIVTAQKREESVNEVPITISAISAERMENLGVFDTRDLGKIVPGFKYSATGLNKPVFTLRGVGYNDFSQTASGTVGLYIDEFNLPYPIMAKGPILDIQRIEVLKGPQGTLYGRNTTGGVINYITNLPTEDFQAGVKASYSRFQTYDVEGHVSGYLSDDVGMRLAARTIQSNEGWQHSLTRPGDDIGEQDKWSARYTLEWTPSDTIEVIFGLDHWEDNSDALAAQPIAIEAINPVLGDLALSPLVRNHPLVPLDTDNIRVADWPDRSLGYDWKYDDTFTMPRARLNWDVSADASLSYLVSYADFETDGGTLPSSGLSVLNGEGLMDVKTEAWSHELRLTGEWGDDLHYILGVFVSKDDVHQFWTGLVPTLSVLFPNSVTGVSPYADKIDSFADQKAKTQALFADVSWALSPTMGLTLGARYTEESRDFEGCTADNPDAVGSGFNAVLNGISVIKGGSGGAGRGDCITLDHQTANPGLVKKDLDQDNLSGRVVLDWSPVEDWLFYASYSRGYKSGSFPIGQASDSEQYRPAVQERLDALEIGVKLSLLSRSLQLNFAAFDYDYRDKQLLSYTYDDIFGALQQLDNAPRSSVQGAEIDLQALPADGLDLFLAASYIDTEIKKFIGINQAGETEDFSGRKFNNAPEFTAYAGFNYIFSLPAIDAFDITFGMDFSYTDDTSSVLNDDPRYHLDDYTNLNLRVGLLGRGENYWSVTAWGRNVTDEYQPVSVGLLAVDAIQRYLQMPRTYGVTVEYRYGG